MWRKVAVAGVLAGSLSAACSSADEPGPAEPLGAAVTSTTPRIGVILPDPATVPPARARDADHFRAAFRAVGMPADVRTAQGGGASFERIGESMIRDGVKVLVITSPDAAGGKAVIARAHEKGVPVIDFDRLTVNGDADYFVGFDTEQIGRMQAYGLMKCLSRQRAVDPIIAELSGSPDDNNAALLLAGHDYVLDEEYSQARYRKGPSQFIPDWSPAQAQVVFTQMISQQPKIGAVLAADDDIADVVIRILRASGRAGIPVTGQNATLRGLQNILAGDQCMTVYKRIDLEAGTAANIAVQLSRGGQPVVNGQIKDPESNKSIPQVALEPRPITIGEVKDVVADGYVKADQLCQGSYRRLCQEHGVTG